MNGGTFTAESSFLTLLSSTSITFGADIGAIDTLVLDNGGGLLNLSQTSPVAGFQSGGEDVIDDLAVTGANVASYAITQSASGQPDVLTFYNAAAASLGQAVIERRAGDNVEVTAHRVVDVVGGQRPTAVRQGVAAVVDNGA